MTEASRLSPAEWFPGLFEEVQQTGVFPDSKTFCDLIPLNSPEAILEAYRNEKSLPNFQLRTFLDHHFIPPGQRESGFTPKPGITAEEHVARLWSYLMREGDNPTTSSSLIPLPFPYVVPGGRFQEIYYWDSYFTFLGLLQCGKIGVVTNMVDNFAWLIDQFGFIPNGNRTYFLSRSQPPFFALMVSLLAEHSSSSSDVYHRYAPALLREYQFWMEGASGLHAGEATRRVAATGSQAVLNRYWDDCPEPRQESWREDIHLASQSARPSEDLWRDLRAACESGWDFSSRWLRDPGDLGSIRTTSLLPVDLNCLLFGLESVLHQAAPFHPALRDRQEEFAMAARARSEAIQTLFWNKNLKTFCDFDLETGSPSECMTLAMAFPLFLGIATRHQAGQVAACIEKEFLKSGGLVTTTVYSGQQWDAPNGWAPLQWVATQGLGRYGFSSLSAQIRRRWLALNDRVFADTGKMMEKYQVENPETPAGGGEYPNQDGFGWTNGVYLAMKALPEEADHEGSDGK